MKGLNIFYYGKGKGKTTAVIGLAVRAAGAGMNVCILQFVKAQRPKPGQPRKSGEWPLSNEFNYFDAQKPTKKIGKIDYQQLGLGFVGILGDKKKRVMHIRAAQAGLTLAKKIIKSRKYNLVIFYELFSALHLNLISDNKTL